MPEILSNLLNFEIPFLPITYQIIYENIINLTLDEKRAMICTDSINADRYNVVLQKFTDEAMTSDDGKVFAYDNDANQLWSFCEGYYERDGTYKPQKTGYSFGHWEVHDTCNEIEQITAYEHLNTDLVPLWDDDDQLCKKIVAVWCNDAENKVPNENGDCVCKQGYYMDGTECKKCSDGLLTLEPGATAESECIEVFKYGTDGVWFWPGNIDSGKTLMNVKGQ